MGSINISLKHGVNPSLDTCFYCGEPKAVILFGRLPGDKEAPHACVTNMEPCDSCQRLMEKGIVCISVRTGEKPSKNPYRTGGWCVLTEEGFTRLFSGPEVDETVKTRVAFIDDQTWDQVGLPRENIAEKQDAS